MLLLRLDCGLALAASLNDATIMPVEGRDDTVEDVATDTEPMQLPPTSVVRRLGPPLASSRKSTTVHI
jgi:hypothetical protein